MFNVLQIQSDVCHTPVKIGICFDGSGVLAVFPESPFTLFSLMELLGGSTGAMNVCSGDDILAGIRDQRMVEEDVAM